MHAYMMHLSALHLACAALATLALLAAAEPPASPPHHVVRREFNTSKSHCNGVYDAAMFDRLVLVCNDCDDLFREPELYNLCRKNCFTSEFFKGCVEAMYQMDQLELYREYLKTLQGGDPQTYWEKTNSTATNATATNATTSNATASFKKTYVNDSDSSTEEFHKPETYTIETDKGDIVITIRRKKKKAKWSWWPFG